MNVEHCMSREPKACFAGDDLGYVARVMWEEDCGFVPVIEQEGRVIGVVTDRDVCMAALHSGAPLWALRAYDAMARTIYCCRPEDALEDAERTMQVAQVRRLPVIDDEDRLVGVLSLNDVARHTRARADARATRDPLVRELVATLGAVCEPRRGSVDALASRIADEVAAALPSRSTAPKRAAARRAKPAKAAAKAGKGGRRSR